MRNQTKSDYTDLWLQQSEQILNQQSWRKASKDAQEGELDKISSYTE